MRDLLAKIYAHILRADLTRSTAVEFKINTLVRHEYYRCTQCRRIRSRENRASHLKFCRGLDGDPMAILVCFTPVEN